MNRKTQLFGSCRAAARTRLAAFLFVGMFAGACGSSSMNMPDRPSPVADANDPRAALAAGLTDPGVAALGLELVAHRDRAEGFVDPTNFGNILFANSDIAFQGDLLFMGNFHGFNIYDISRPAQLRLRTSVVCPGGQGDLSVHGNLMFMSVEMPNGRVDCGTDAPSASSSPDRFRGVRIFDITDIERPRQVGGVQTCRGSHTHTLVPDPQDDSHVFIYVSGTSGVRPATELAGCSGAAPGEDPTTALFRIEVIEVPLAAPENARIVSSPRIFADAAGNIAGLWPGGEHGDDTQSTATTDQCHDITVYQELGYAAGACSGNGILLDINDPAAPVRIDEVSDPNFAYWHSATFSNDGSTLLFTDEWGGGGAPRCLVTDDPKWGADAFFRLNEGEMTPAGYFKLPAAQTDKENCVAHNGSLIPVPGRDIFVQAWYQGGVSVIDFTDPDRPFEIAYFDRGPYDATQMLLGGFWSTYWYNGRIYASEIGRGLDVFRLTPAEHLTQNEIDAAEMVHVDEFNPQTQKRIVWPVDVTVARALLDQLGRGKSVPADRLTSLRGELDRAAGLGGNERQSAMSALSATAAELAGQAKAGSADARRLEMLAGTLRGLTEG